MTTLEAPSLQLRRRRDDLIVRPIGNEGEQVVKDRRTGEYYNLGPEEAFLFNQLDGRPGAERICAAFEREFDQPLPESDLADFLDTLEQWRLLEPLEGVGVEPQGAHAGDETRHLVHRPARADSTRAKAATVGLAAEGSNEQSILYWRKSVFDPDRLFTWLEPKIRFVWTRSFVIVSTGGILLAALFVWTERQALMSQFPAALRWETWLLAWLTLCLVTTLHEFAHGLTCKHYGGEVREVGFLLLFFIPCFYCNVSDAWLIREKSKRLYVTLAGGWCDLICWAIAVLVWRVTMQDSLINYLAWVVLAVCGMRSFFNFNPLIKLDGYYLLSDLMEIRNLRQRAWDRVMGYVRAVLWGAPAPEPELRSRFLMLFGLATWAYALLFLTVMFMGLFHLGSGWLGPVGIVLVCALGGLVARSLLTDIFQGEVSTMFRQRRKRTLIWLVLIVTSVVTLTFLKLEQRAAGSFEVRATVREEVRAPVAGFLREVFVEEGQAIAAGERVGVIEIPDLASRTEQKRAELKEVEARLRLLEAGTREELIAEQTQRVERASRARDIAQQDLERAEEALQEELLRLTQLIKQRRLEAEYAAKVLELAIELNRAAALNNLEVEDARTKASIAELQLQQAEAEYRARKAVGTTEQETRLAERQHELAETRGSLVLLSLGPRPEELGALQAELARMEEELRYLEILDQRTVLQTTAAGIVATPYLCERVNQYFREGEPICLIEEPSSFVTQVTLAEEQVASIRQGQRVELKFRALPYRTFTGTVERIAPAATVDEFGLHSQVTVYCRLDEPPAELRSGMTGYARIFCGKRVAGALLSDRVLRFIRTEFWW